MKRFEEAILNYEKVISLNPKEVDALFYQGNVCCAQSKYEEAIVSYERALIIFSFDERV